MSNSTFPSTSHPSQPIDFCSSSCRGSYDPSPDIFKKLIPCVRQAHTTRIPRGTLGIWKLFQYCIECNVGYCQDANKFCYTCIVDSFIPVLSSLFFTVSKITATSRPMTMIALSWSQQHPNLSQSLQNLIKLYRPESKTMQHLALSSYQISYLVA